MAADEHSEKDKTKAGTLRAGSTGVMLPTGEIACVCPRAAHVRFLGFEAKSPSDADLIMFQLGVASEDLIVDDILKGGLAPGEFIKREEEIPIRWETSTGIPVTGRPDVVICTQHPTTGEAVPQLVIEAKSVASFWVLKNLLEEEKPKLSNVLQAAHYAWQLNVPAKLVYKQYAIHTTPDWCEPHFPREGEPGSEHIEYTNKKKNGRGSETIRVVKSIRQFEKVFDVKLDEEGYVLWKIETSPHWTNSTVRLADVKRFYEFVGNMAQTGKVGPISTVMNADGTFAKYTMCQYCPPELHCEDAVKNKWNYHTWINHVKTSLKL
jgi:hypothetical protein